MAVLHLDPDAARHIEAFREIRLQALRTDPAAFGSTYEREVAFDHTAWRTRVASYTGRPGAVFLAESSPPGLSPAEPAKPLIGVVGVGLPEADDASIWGMWVALDGRRQGVAGALLDAAEQWAANAGAQTATLWVNRSNERAKGVYERRGYKLVDGADLPLLVPSACSDEMCLRRRLRGA